MLEIWAPYLHELGWEWVPSKEHYPQAMRLRKDELPEGWIIAHCLQHAVAICDGVMYDTRDHSRGGSLVVYGYFRPSTAVAVPASVAPIVGP